MAVLSRFLCSSQAAVKNAGRASLVAGGNPIYGSGLWSDAKRFSHEGRSGQIPNDAKYEAAFQWLDLHYTRLDSDKPAFSDFLNELKEHLETTQGVLSKGQADIEKLRNEMTQSLKTKEGLSLLEDPNAHELKVKKIIEFLHKDCKLYTKVYECDDEEKTVEELKELIELYYIFYGRPVLFLHKEHLAEHADTLYDIIFNPFYYQRSVATGEPDLDKAAIDSEKDGFWDRVLGFVVGANVVLWANPLLSAFQTTGWW